MDADDLSAAATFWNAGGEPSNFVIMDTVSLKIANQKDVSKFQTCRDLSHTVTLHVGQSQLQSITVNSLILALHSSVFEKLLFSGEETIEIDSSLQKLPQIGDAVHQAILFLHGKDIQISQEVLEVCFGFAYVYDISVLSSLCLERYPTFIKSGEDFEHSFLRIARNYPSPWRETLLLSL